MRLAAALLPVAILLPLAESRSQVDTATVLFGKLHTASGESRLLLGTGVALFQPVGEFANSVNRSSGGDFHIAWRFGDSGEIALRLEGVVIRYGEEKRAVSGRVPGEITTANEIYWMNIGPQLMATHGRIRPYVNAGVGIADFNTSSSFKAQVDDQSSGEADNLDKLKVSFAAGAGAVVSLLQQSGILISLDAGARYHEVGRAQYLRQGAIEDLPDGSIRLNPTTSAANFVTYHVGVTISGVPSPE